MRCIIYIFFFLVPFNNVDYWNIYVHANEYKIIAYTTVGLCKIMSYTRDIEDKQKV